MKNPNPKRSACRSSQTREFTRSIWPLLGACLSVLILLAGCVHATHTSSTAAATTPPPERRGHSHNDYTRREPLTQALSLGFGSIEADVFLVDGVLMVAHDRDEIRPHRTLTAMYFDPLAARAAERGGHIYATGEPPLLLFIDIKADGPAAYRAIHTELERRRDTFTRFEDGVVTPAAVTVIISGDIPRDLIAAQPLRWAFVDGRIPDLQCDRSAAPPPTLIPVVSIPYLRHFTWLGHGEMSAEETARLQNLAQTAHDRGYLLRFWSVPNVESVWQSQIDAGVDLLNADDLPRAAAFLRSYTPPRCLPAERRTPRPDRPGRPQD